MNLLYLGDSNINSTSFHRADALRRLGHNVIVEDPYLIFYRQLASRWIAPMHWYTGYKFIQNQIAPWIATIGKENPGIDLIWIDSGELFGEKSLKILKSLNCPVVLYNIDDPTGKRDGKRFNTLLKAISQYNLIAVVREETKRECERLGNSNVMRVFRSYDEIAHRPFENIQEIQAEFRSDVAFIGTWMRNEDRDQFLLELKKRSVPLSIWGDRWQKSSYWNELKSSYRGKALGGRNYVAALQGAKICLGLLSKGNRDLHTTRSLEVPFAGGLLCAERTNEHQMMYKENYEAVYWSNAEECAEVCKMLLMNENRREEIRIAGMERVRENRSGNEDICKSIINMISSGDTTDYSSQPQILSAV